MSPHTDVSRAEEYKLGLLQFLNNIYRENRIPNECRNAVITPIFKQGDRREDKNCRGISNLNTCYNIYSKILNLKMQNHSEVFMTGTENEFRKGAVMYESNILT